MTLGGSLALSLSQVLSLSRSLARALSDGALPSPVRHCSLADTRRLLLVSRQTGALARTTLGHERLSAAQCSQT